MHTCSRSLARCAVIAVFLGAAFATTVATPASSSQPAVRAVRSPSSSPGDRLNGVSFVSDTRGWAVGSSGVTLQGTGLDRLIQRYDGTRWRNVPIEAIPTSDEVLTGVTATGANDAWAVGWRDRYGYSATLPLRLRWDGSSWQSVAGSFDTGVLRAVDASGPSDVWAVGTYIEHFDGNQWRTVPFPSDIGSHFETAVAAVSPDDAWIAAISFVGSYGGRGQTLLEHWDGTSWRVVRTPRTDSDDRLAAITAVSSDDVWAVGSTDGRPLAMHWDGTQWRRVPTRTAGPNSTFTSVAVDANGMVWAFGHQDGYDHQGYAVWRTLAERYDGTSWTIVPSPDPYDAADSSFAGAGSAGTEAWAVGANRGTLVAWAS